MRQDGLIETLASCCLWHFRVRLRTLSSTL
jgi:hypothetical protein